jgi:hypothetical protein
MLNEKDFCDADSGFDYIFSRMSAVYGSAFLHHWKGIDPLIVRQTWKDACGRGLTYRPKMDYALQYMNAERPPSALAFAKLLNDGPVIPDRNNYHLSMNEPPANPEIARKAMEKIRNILNAQRNTKTHN